MTVSSPSATVVMASNGRFAILSEGPGASIERVDAVFARLVADSRVTVATISGGSAQCGSNRFRRTINGESDGTLSADDIAAVCAYCRVDITASLDERPNR